MNPVLLGVERSITGRRWQRRPGDERAALAISQRLGLPELVGRVLAGRRVGIDEAEAFLNPTLRGFLPDPSTLRDLDLAAERLAGAVMGGEKIALFGDYDVDGATSSALLARFLGAAGARTRLYIPDRRTEGYGPNAPALLKLKAEGAGLVIAVDCGTTAFEPIATAAQAGLDIIVVDHHEAEPALPKAFAIVNPNRLDQEPGLGHLAAVGVAFLLAIGTNRALRQAGWYQQGRTEPDLMAWLDLVALGTVCDVVPLTGLNRALVSQGLKVMARRANAGLAALADVAGMTERPGAFHAGYILGPRVNAGGRLGGADLGARLLATDDPEEAKAIARQLDGFNRQRQEVEAAVLYEAIEQVERDAQPDDAVLIAAGQGWHPGVVGIVAGRLKERYARPALVIGIEEGVGKGSGRSVAGIDLGSAIIAARQAGILDKGGGHAMAAGFTLRAERLPDLRQFLKDRLADQADTGLVPVLDLDGVLEVGGASLDLIETIERCGPFGAGNDEPRFALSGAQIGKADLVGSGHVRCQLVGSSGARLKAIAFRVADSDLGLALLNSAGAPLHLAGTLRADHWQGRKTVQFVIDDAGRV
ncbi:MAG: single-stranded-DNA-specific exonuclease RecJ [Rhodospirillales bacterium]|nr:single-stranded-DNA-specific exonuclease RecJ [Rhodospirillales bacterium]